MNTVYEQIWEKLAKSKKYRDNFVAANARRLLPFQIRVLMQRNRLSQEKLAAKAGLTQGVISRAADPNYGNLTINTIVKIANGLDVAYLGIYVPFSELSRFVAYLSEEAVLVDSFVKENEEAHKHVAGLKVELPLLPRPSYQGVGGAESTIPTLGSVLQNVKQKQSLASSWRN
jgi:transcriptional regulator with XRE-family HTH domain